jgi:hypothetical protein
MYRNETLIVVSNDIELSAFGIKIKPILNNGNYLLPLGWEEELTNNGVEFEVREVEIYEEPMD